MANTFKNRTLRAVGTSPVDVGAVVLGSTQTTLIGMTVANITTGVISVTVQLINHPSGGSATTTHIVQDAPIPTGGSLVVLGGDQKVVLMEDDKITVTSNTASSADVIMSFLEIT
jgi:hypothetical protein